MSAKLATIGLTLMLSSPTAVLAQAAGAGADYNQADRELVKAQAQQECLRNCDNIGRSNANVCYGYPLEMQSTCNLNIMKQTAACYQGCK